MAKLGIRQRYCVIVPVLRTLLQEHPEMAITMRGTLQKMVARGRITGKAREVFLESILVPLAPAKKPSSSTKNKAAEVTDELFSPNNKSAKK